MTVEELLKPRYKVIADYPNNVFPIGQIVTHDNELWINDDSIKLCRTDVVLYPHLFKKLEWWEERAESDLPEYVKSNPSSAIPFCIYKVRKWDYRTGEFTGNNYLKADGITCSNLLPATLEEYNAQQK